MKRALLNPHGWEVVQGDGEGLTAPLGRDSLVLHQGDGMTAQPNSLSQTDYYSSITDAVLFTTSSNQELGTIRTNDNILHVEIKTRRMGTTEPTSPITITAVKRVKSHGLSDLPVRLTAVDTTGLDCDVFGAVGNGAVISVFVSGGIVGDECSFSIYSASI